MLIDPRRRRRSRGQQSGEPAPLVVIVALAMEIADLRELADWEPVGSLLGELTLAARNEGSLTTREVARLRMWAANYRALASDVRAFYAANHDEAESCLWYILGTGRTPSGPALGRARRAFIDAHGYPAPFDLTPTPATQESR